jgi:hypothetical protein
MKLRIFAAIFVACSVIAETAQKSIQLAGILAWKHKPATKWLTDGVPLLKMKEHLEERAPKAALQ